MALASNGGGVFVDPNGSIASVDITTLAGTRPTVYSDPGCTIELTLPYEISITTAFYVRTPIIGFISIIINGMECATPSGDPLLYNFASGAAEGINVPFNATIAGQQVAIGGGIAGGGISVASDLIWDATDDMLRGASANAGERFAVAASSIIGKLATGRVKALTVAETKTLLAIVAADISNFNTAVRLNTVADLAVPLAALDMNGNKITGGATPTIATDYAIKSYVDGLAAAGQQVKAACGTSTTGNITLSGEQTIDGILTSGTRVLVKDQTDQTQNGIYVSASGAWSRATDSDTGAELVNAYVTVTAGTAGAGKSWQQITPATITIGASNIVWNLYSSLAGTGWTVVSKTGAYTANDREIVECDTSGGAFTVTVPNTANVQCVVKRMAGAANLTISPSSGSIDGGGSIILTENFSARWMVGNGTNVGVIGERRIFDSPVSLGGPESEGTLGSVPRSDHVHGTKITKNTQTDNYTLVLSDADNKVIEMNKTTNNTLTIPPSASVAWETGTTIEVYQMGTGTTTITPGSGVTLRAPNGARGAHQYATMGLRYRGSNEWVLSGDTMV